MDPNQIRDELKSDPKFLECCPFETKIDDSVMIKVGTGKDDYVSPIDVAKILLTTIREEAEAYFEREKEIAVGMETVQCEESIGSNHRVLNCVISVPAHFSRRRRETIVSVAREAGFKGHVSTIVESTAAAMAYGLFTTPLNNHEGNQRRIMVFDMGGGTTDVTICKMVQKDTDQDPSFQVLVTAGKKRLGGDDMDMQLVEYAIESLASKGKENYKISHDLRISCRTAKEELCGDGKDELPASKTEIRMEDKFVEISQEKFDELITDIVEKASDLVDNALVQCDCDASSIDEVILVGGATRTPSIRTMLQNKFKNELCYAIDPYAAVAQGAAIQAAIDSKLVPKHVLRNALMLDALPHPIGVLVGAGNNEQYVPILERGMTLPAMHYATFRLSDVRQKGVTIIAVEDVDEDLPLERIGEFTFLLHRLSDEDYIGLEKSGGRTVNIGMTVETNGKFIVSIFDENDPEHLEKKERYQEWKRNQNGTEKEKKVYSLGKTVDKTRKSQSFAIEELLLIFACFAVVFIYVAVKMLFPSLEETSSSIL